MPAGLHMNEIPPTLQTARTGENPERLILKGLLIFFIATAVYIPAMSGGYIYDDDTLLTANQLITRGTGFFDAPSWSGLAAIWFPANEPSVSDYAPLSSTSFWIEWRLWGPGTPAGYHITNILLHAAGALLLWAVLARMRAPGSWLTALVWAAHPVGAESVAWIAERRNVLSMPLLMMALLAWLCFQETRRPGNYVLALVLFAATLLAKSTAVMLPLFLLLWIWWKRDSVTKRDCLEAAPFFAVSLAFGLVTTWFQYVRAIADEQMPIDGLLHRAASACFALGFYAVKAVLPFSLMFNYPEWHKSVWAGWQALAVVPFVAVFAWAWRERAGWGRHVILGLGFFVIMIAPALGVMKMAYMRITLVADHFEYMPMAGLIALAVAGAASAVERPGAKVSKPIFDAVAGCVVIFLGVLTWQRGDVFHDPESLWVDTLSKNPDAWQAHEHLGGILMERGDLQGSFPHFKRGVELRPNLGETHNNYGNILRNLRMDPALALAENAKAVELAGQNIAVRFSYAQALEQAGRLREAAEQYKVVLQMDPMNAVICCKIGELLLQTGSKTDAVAYFQRALQLAPGFTQAQQDLHDALQPAK